MMARTGLHLVAQMTVGQRLSLVVRQVELRAAHAHLKTVPSEHLGPMEVWGEYQQGLWG
jgi:hypothetical protein